MKRKVYLDGEMAQKFGSEFTIQAKTTADIFRNLECNFPELREYLIDCHEKDIGFVLKVGDTQVEEEELLLSLGQGDVYISPQPSGSKGVGKILAAIAIIALVVYAPYLMTAAAQAGGLAGSIGMTVAGTIIGATPFLIGVAVNLALTGIQEIMAPDPSVDDFNNDKETSYLFQGAEQNVIEGDPVPVVYGQLRVPGRPIGFEIRNKENVFYNGWSSGGVQGAGPDWQFIKGYNYVLD